MRVQGHVRYNPHFTATMMCILVVRKRELGASCGMSDVCRDDNAHCTSSSSSSSSGGGGTSGGQRTCQCLDTFYQTVDAVCSTYLCIHHTRAICKLSANLFRIKELMACNQKHILAANTPVCFRQYTASL